MSMYDDRDAPVSRDPLQSQATTQMLPPQQSGYPQQHPGYGYPYGYGRGFGMGMGMGMGNGFRRNGWSETKPFFMTSEFLATLLCVIGVAITAASAADIDSRLSCILITALVGAYTISRGIAKSGTRSRATDPRDELQLGGGSDGHHHD
jgi:hypothetical protein